MLLQPCRGYMTCGIEWFEGESGQSRYNRIGVPCALAYVT